MLLSKALKMQQDTEDRRHEVIVKGLEDKIKEFEASLKEKDILLQTAKGSLAEVQSQNAMLSEELDEARTILDESSRRFNRETKELEAKVKAETERNTKLQEAFENIRNKCADFATRCANRLKGIFSSVGAASEEINPSAEDIPRPLIILKMKGKPLMKLSLGTGILCLGGFTWQSCSFYEGRVHSRQDY
jgi:DNA repair exonuclease SbcCD ATPase subunit